MGGGRVMSAVKLHETIDGNGFIVNYQTYKAKKEEIVHLKKEIAELKQENAELKQEKEFYDKKTTGWSDLVQTINNSHGPITFNYNDTYTDCLRKLHEYISNTCTPVMVNLQQSREEMVRVGDIPENQRLDHLNVLWMLQGFYAHAKTTEKEVDKQLQKLPNQFPDLKRDWQSELQALRTKKLELKLNYLMQAHNEDAIEKNSVLKSLTDEILKFRAWNARDFHQAVDVDQLSSGAEIVKKMSENIQFNFRQKKEVVRQIKQRIKNYPQVFRDSFTDDSLENRDLVSLVVDVMGDFISYIDKNCDTDQAAQIQIELEKVGDGRWTYGMKQHSADHKYEHSEYKGVSNEDQIIKNVAEYVSDYMWGWLQKQTQWEERAKEAYHQNGKGDAKKPRNEYEKKDEKELLSILEFEEYFDPYTPQNWSRVKKAYVRLAKLYHEDNLEDDSEEEKDKYRRLFTAVTAAYQELLDRKKEMEKRKQGAYFISEPYCKVIDLATALQFFNTFMQNEAQRQYKATGNPYFIKRSI